MGNYKNKETFTAYRFSKQSNFWYYPNSKNNNRRDIKFSLNVYYLLL
jgi:hypothetical protein